jgi:hypothetical protein
MKRFATSIFLTVCLVPLAAAQDKEHVQLGVFADYIHLAQTNTDFLGVGGRVSLQAYKGLKLEGEASFDLEQPFNELFTMTSTGARPNDFSNMRLFHGEIGPRVNIGHHLIQPFVTLKGGFMDFRLDNRPPFLPLPTFVSDLDGLRSSNVNAVLHPGVGVEAHLGRIGVRADIGDEIYFNHGSHNNLRITFGPIFRF